MSSILRRKEVLMGLLIIVSVFIYLPYFFEVPTFMTSTESWLQTWRTVISGFTCWLGVYYMTRRVMVKTQKREKGYQYQIILGFFAWFTILVGLFLGKDHVAFDFVARGFMSPGDATVYALVVFYLTSAAARSFKVKNLSSALLLITAFFVVMKNAPFSEALFPFMAPIGDWFQDYLGSAASRVFSISAGLGGLVLAMRLLLGKEMAMLGLFSRKEEE